MAKKSHRVDGAEPAENYHQEILEIYHTIKRDKPEAYSEIKVPECLSSVAGKENVLRTLSRPDYARHTYFGKPHTTAEGVVALIDSIIHDSLRSDDRKDFSDDYVVYCFWHRLSGKGTEKTPTEFENAQIHGSDRARHGKFTDRERGRKDHRRDSAEIDF